MASVRYEVQVHGYGRKRITYGPSEGLLDFPAHKWTCITRRPVGLKRAKELADAQPTHATVCVWQTAEVVYDNGKVPGVPEGWYPSES